ncbi:hypothetical protein NEDG_01300 [Nematocida displodere]|uniref:Structural maintenance of chromosomes protein 5 n=1 Tax=Nematocida displodere TaxID=1805483 RepID=A0A177EBB0_9MICR|nr:hypothetical protein NEDG_01300 [Nematocida displodere]
MGAYIRTLTLDNFQKYKRVVFTFTRYGNMIIGRNGSGKSTVAAAIALVLGGSSKTMGKTHPVHEFIRFGESRAVIGLEVVVDQKDVLGQFGAVFPNLGDGEEFVFQITRSIASNGSFFKINQQAVTIQQVKKITQAVGICIDNLGQFLPQDRVMEFSTLSEEEQLETTLKTCLPGVLAKKKELEALDDQHAEHKKALAVRTAQVQEKRRELSVLEEESEKLKNLLRRKETITLLQGKIKWVEYAALKARYDTAAQEIAKLKEEVGQQSEATRCKQKEYSQHKDELQNKAPQTLSETFSAEKFTAQIQSIKALEDDTEAATRKISVLDEKIASLEKEREEIQAHQTSFQARAAPAQEFTAEHQSELSALEQTYRQELVKESEWQAHNAIGVAAIKSTELLIKKEEEKEERQLEKLKLLHRDTYTAVVLMKESSQAWEVDLPAFLTLQITQAEFSAELSSQLSLHALTTFVCHSKESFQAFVKEFKETHQLAVNVVEKQPSTYKLPERLPIDSKFEMAYLSECLTAPPAVHEFLNVFAKLSLIPVTRAYIDETEFFSLHPKVVRAISQKRVIEIKRSKYTTDTTLVISPMGKGIDLDSKPENSGLVQKLENLKEERDQRRLARESAIRAKVSLEARIKELRATKDIDEKEADRYERQKRAHQIMVERSEEARQEIEFFHGEREQEEKEWTVLLKKEQGLFHKLSIFNLIDALKELVDRSKTTFEAETLLKAEERELHAFYQTLSSLKVQLSQVEVEAATHQQDAKRKLKEAREIIKVETPETKELMKTLPSDTPSLTILLEQEKAKIELSVVDESSIEEYHKCKGAVKTQESLIAASEKQEANTASKKKHLEEEIKTEIEETVECLNCRLQDLFASVSAKVALSVEYSASPRKWRLLLKVQFRAEGALAALSAGRQSGGEKSVSIILYLLAMQSFTNSPFSLVDEVNQGMDADHERSIHGLLLGPQARLQRQIIVITPKLVPHLVYSPHTTVHAIIET